MFGEFGISMINNPLKGSDDEDIAVKEEDLLEILNDINSKKYSNSLVKEYLMNCCMKIHSKLSTEGKEIVNSIMEAESKSRYCEVQQRAVEYLLLSKADYSLTKNILALIPNSVLLKDSSTKKLFINKGS